MKNFLLGALKLAAALVLAAVVLGVAAWVINAVNEGREAARNAPLGEPKSWPLQTVGALDNAKLTLLTKWDDGSMRYQFELRGYPASLSERKDTPSYEWH